MTATLERPPSELGDDGGGGVAARRAVVRWTWRLFRREWRQQTLVLALIVLAVAATIVGSAVATDSPPPARAGFGTAHDLVSLQGPKLRPDAALAALKRRVGQIDVIENQVAQVPGSVDTYDLRSQNPDGPFGRPMLSLLSGRYPVGSGQVALSPVLASALDLGTGDVWREAGRSRLVVGMVRNPQDLLDSFALVAPGQVSSPTQVSILFDARPSEAASIASLHLPVQTAPDRASRFGPETIVLSMETVGMLLIGLVAIAGFTVLAQRRLRAIGLLGSLGATDADIRLVVLANGALVGLVGIVLGCVLGLVVWLAYRPHLETSVHHLIGTLALPWGLVASALALALVASVLAALRPAVALTRVPIVAALSGRPAPPKPAHRSVAPAVVLLVAAFLLLAYAGRHNSGGGGMPELVLGFVTLMVGIIVVAPLCVGALGGLGRAAPLSVRMALRDLGRYRSRSGAALGAISLGVLIAVVICVAANARYNQVLDYTGPNLAPNQLVLYTPTGGPNGPSAPIPPGRVSTSMQAAVADVAGSLGARRPVELDTTSATLFRATPGNNNFYGQVFVATPQLLSAFGIRPGDVESGAVVLSMRDGLGSIPHLQLVYGSYFSNGSKGSPSVGAHGDYPCPPGSCVPDPRIQHLSRLPSGTAAPNTVITEQAVRALGLGGQESVVGWLMVSPHALTSLQVSGARQAAAAAGMTIESKSGLPSSSEVLNWATVAGMLLALGVLAMTVGLIRSETAGDLRTLAATGAAARTRRAITAATAGALGLVGALLGTAAAYLAAIAWFRSGQLGQSVTTSLSRPPIANLLVLLVGLPLVAAAGGWLLAGREPRLVSRQPLD